MIAATYSGHPHILKLMKKASAWTCSVCQIQHLETVTKHGCDICAFFVCPQCLANSPADPSALTHEIIVELSSTRQHCFAVCESGALFFSDALKTATPSFLRATGIPESEHVTHISSSEDHTLALTKSGRVYASGANQHGQLGTTPSTTPTTSFALIESEHTFTAVAAGSGHSLLLTSQNQVLGCGASDKVTFF